MNNKYRLNRKEIEQYLASREEEFLSGHDTGQGWERLQRRIAGRRKKRVITRLAYMAVCLIALGGFFRMAVARKRTANTCFTRNNIGIRR